MTRTVIYRGVDGSVWHLHGDRMGEEGVYFTSVAGLYHPVSIPLDQRPAYMAGAVPGAPKIDPRVVDMKIFTSADTEEDWELVEDRWWEAWSDEADGILEVYSRRGRKRTIPVRLQKWPTEPFDFEPEDVFDWTLPIIMYQPYWVGATYSSGWINTDGSGEGKLKVVNPGNVDIWVEYAGTNDTGDEIWTLADGIHGDSVTFQDGLGVDAGPWLFDTDQMNQIGLETYNETQAAALMAGMRFRHTIPAKTFTPVEVDVSVENGTTNSKVKVFCTALHKRPW